MNRRPGRPKRIDASVVIKTLLNYKDQIILPGDLIISKTNDVWKKISNELMNRKSPFSLYSFVCNNLCGVRDLLNNRPLKINNGILVEESDVLNESTDFEISDSQNSSADKDFQDNVETVFSLSLKEFSEIVIEKKYKSKGTNQIRIRKKLAPGIWQDRVSEKIWNNTKLSCGFNFKNNYLSDDASAGSITGKCKCGSILNIRLEASENCVKFYCTIKCRSGTCGKRYLRGTKRELNLLLIICDFAYNRAKHFKVRVIRP